jgi:hypothetical protein
MLGYIADIHSRRPPYGAGIPWPIPGQPAIRLLLVLAIFFVVLQVALNPWIFRIGGKLTPSMSWQGVGMVASSNGGHYVLYTMFNGRAPVR